MHSIDHLIHAQWIITCEEDNRTLEHHSLALHQGKIIDILPTSLAKERYQANHISDFSTHVIMPGFINAHTHIAMNLFRGLADDLELMDWLTNHIWPAEGKWVSHDMVYDGSLLAIAEMIRGGTLCFNDMYFYLGATAEAAAKAGMRAHIGMTVIDVPTAWAKTTEEYFAKAIEFYEQYKHHPLVTPTLAPHSTYTVSIENLERVKRLADDYQLKINMHLQEAPSEMAYSHTNFNERPLKRIHDIGLVSPQLIAIHMTQLNQDDFVILSETKPNIVHCPESNMKLVSGSCPVETLLNMGVNVALGTDGAASNNDLDMFGEMRTAAFLGKVTADDPKAVAAERALKMATIHGARALGIADRTGSLEVGKDADFIAIDFNHLETQPVYHPVSQVVYSTPRSQVTDAWVGGKPIMTQRKLVHLDEQEIIAKAQMWRNKIKS